MTPNTEFNAEEQNSEPLISVIMPCYKMGRFIGEALESVGKQSYGNWEVIAVDDCGPEDGTREAVEEFAARYPGQRIEYHRLAENRGVSAARNAGLHAAEGRYLAFLDPDDWWRADHLSEAIKTFHGKKELSVVIADATRVGDGGMDAGYEMEGYSAEEKRMMPYILGVRNCIPMSGVCVLTGVLQALGGFDETRELQHIEDWDLWIRLADSGADFAFTGARTAYYRKHPGAATSDEAACRRRLHSFALRHWATISKYSWVMQVEYMVKLEFCERRLNNLEAFPQGFSSRMLRMLKMMLRRGV